MVHLILCMVFLCKLSSLLSIILILITKYLVNRQKKVKLIHDQLCHYVIGIRQMLHSESYVWNQFKEKILNASLNILTSEEVFIDSANMQ